MTGVLEYRRPTGDFTNDQLLQGVRRAAGTVRDLAAKIEQSRAGAFVIEGTYPTKPSTFTFRYRYVFEGVDWKLVGLYANVK